MKLTLGATLLVIVLMAASQVGAQGKPNILMIMSDDVGITNISAYSRGMAGYHTPNIDRIANEGALFTDYYAEHPPPSLVFQPQVCIQCGPPGN